MVEDKTIHFVVHYSEIAIKGKNREVFEKKLIDNLKERLGKQAIKVLRRYGRVIIESEEKDKQEVIEILSLFPGIEYFAEIKVAELDLEKIKKVVLDLCKEKEFETFKIVTRRSFKSFPHTSDKINQEVGAYVVDELHKKAKMVNPELAVNIEIEEKEVLIFSEKIKSIGGLPANISGKLICLLSGGIDSPVASFLMIKRGATVILAHFFNNTINSEAALGKVKEHARILSQYQIESKLYIIPFSDIQKQIIMNVPSTHRMIVYRRIMGKIANEIAKTENAKGILTGDNLGQVASQTMDNLLCIQNAYELPVYCPLIGLNKTEIIIIAQKIKTYETSILPYNDCCSFMIAQHPETHGKLKGVQEFENNIENLSELIKIALKNSQVVNYNNGKDFAETKKS